MNARALLAAATVAVLAASARLAAQGSPRVDSSAASRAIAAGRLDVAEALLYNAALKSTHDPAARGELGAFLAARGQFLIGATLLDEALQFGADTIAIDARLFEVYRWTGQYARAAALRTARVTREERGAMRLASGTVVRGAASATVPLQQGEAPGLGRITLLVGTERVEADIEPVENGLSLPPTPAMRTVAQSAGSRGDTTFATVPAVAIGAVTLGSVPVRIDASIRVARIGLDVLSQFRPTFDFGSGTLTVHSADYVSDGAKLPLMLTFPGVSFFPVEGGSAIALDSAEGRAALRGYRWTLDVSAGAIIIEK